MNIEHSLETKNNRLAKIAVSCAIACSILMITAKTVAWLISDSLAVFASLTDSLLDISASVINLFALNFALQPPDKEHRFGHGKAEDLAVFTQASFFAISGIFLAVNSLHRFITPKIIEKSELTLIILVISIVLTAFLVIFQKYVVKITKSSLVEADNFHYFVDLLSNVLTLFSLYLAAYLNLPIIDTIFAFVLSLYIIWGALQLFKKALRNLLDHEFSLEERQKIKNIINAHPEILGFHNLKTRYSGRKPFIQIHLEMNGNLTLIQAHHVAEQIEQNILQEFNNAEVMIHQDPADYFEQEQVRE